MLRAIDFLELCDLCSDELQVCIDHLRLKSHIEGAELVPYRWICNTAEALLDYADQNGIELIVTGSRGESGFTRLLLGSIAQKLVTYAKVPVVVVK